MADVWPQMELASLFRIAREQMLPFAQPQATYTHYSIPAWDEHAGPVRETGKNIESNKTAISAPSVLVSKLNPRKPRVIAIESVIPNSCCSTEFVCYQPKSSHECLPFWAAYFSSGVFAQRLERVAVGSTNSHTRANPSETLRWMIPNPSLAEKLAISSILGTLDAAIGKTEAIIQKLKQVKQGLMHDLLTRGIDESGKLRPARSEAPHMYKQSPLGWIPKEWTVQPLSKCFPLQRGFDITKEGQIDGHVPVISSSGIASYHAVWRCAPPGVVIGRKGKLGGAYYVDVPYWPHDTTLWVTNFFGNDPEFCCLLLASLRLERFDAATSVPTLNRNVIHPLNVAMPCVVEQRWIVERIDCVDASLDSESIKLHKANRLKSGLMDDLLTGRIRVTPLLKE